MRSSDKPVIVFDGVCVLCNRWTSFIVRHDREGRFRLAAMQGVQGRAMLEAHGLDALSPRSFLLVQDGVGYQDTDAIVRVLRQLGGPWSIASGALRLTPRSLRDAIYRWIARHRYRLFGKRDVCYLPDPGQAWRFID
ncbi:MULTISPECIES: thiol-disulfide oxidoreductase DCC family protein [Dyella]|uniref:thiol-disulfide oxidoreductase DCC family protein n=1 Tax=Dyella TaxID=231454 RepID=UPI001F11347F|nr:MULTISPECIES: thiol-disulfide oxidoreductase DCC family protein [Dyella]